MTICRFFVEGRCRFGEKCWNEHPRGGGRPSRAAPPPSPQRQVFLSSSRGAHNQRYTVVQPSNFSKPTTWSSSRDPGKAFLGSATNFGAPDSGNSNFGFSQNRFTVLNSNQNIGDGFKDEEEKLLESIMKDMEIWESSGQWMFSSYSPAKEKPNISGLQDFSPEELRLEYYNCRANSNIQNYMSSIQQLVSQWRNRLLELRTLNASTRTALVSELKNVVSQPLPAFGFGGQQSSTFGSSTFPMNSSNSDAKNFFFKPSPAIVNAPSANVPSFGNPAQAQDTPAVGVTSPSTASHSVGFGNQAVSAAAAFSFKSSATSGAIGTSGFLGFGSSSTINFSNTTSAPAFGGSNAASAAPTSDSSNTLFGQPVGSLGRNATSAPSVSTNSVMSEKLFTPKSELSAEELKQFEAKKFTLGKIPLKPPPVELLNV
uniref:Nucleoporin NUP42 n=1 Tax=Sphenodon punctatus TaxID=8508 RepID=A0A8D0L502_SPHPU